MNTKTILDLIGNTPLVKIEKLNPNPNLVLLVKLEKNNPGGSIKDRTAKYMIEHAEKSGQLFPGKIVIEPTSGNTGIGIALVCRIKGYDVVIVMPENMSVERRQILVALGAKVLLSEAAKGMDGAEDLAKEIVAKNPDKYFMPNQFANKANVLAHYETTAPEIWRDTEGKITHLVAGIGTTGTLMGVSKRLKEYNPQIKIIGVQPEVGTAIPGLKDLKTQHIPEIWQPNTVDEIHYVNPEKADETARLMALKEGLFVGSSSGAAFYVALQKAKELKEGVIVVIAPDGGEKYLSTSLCDPELFMECAKKHDVKCSYQDGKPVFRK
ncbi:MAG: PLP-dependent cysteine synthase family protein [Candidatus Bathyarchaeota archaeon]|nr:PLP-dependent cysteine synthase family protein [Candidatus Bathyarchaeota archaeon]